MRRTKCKTTIAAMRRYCVCTDRSAEKKEKISKYEKFVFCTLALILKLSD